ncbi:MAG: T9SS type A sorting domain-containing protein [Ignavibacteria bacterium]|nr:T9SS type A sorting domain-containing protein [Ignavibacteria bacterium]
MSRVLLKVYDISGKEITKLADGDFDTGVYEIEFDGSNLASGIYFYKIDVTTLNKVVIESITESKKMVLIK